MTTATRKILQIAQSSDARQAVIDAVGDLSGLEVLFNQVLVGTYVRPEKTAAGVFLPQSTLKEDEYQGKVGLILKIGPTAFKDSDDIDFAGQTLKEGDWVVYRIGDGWPLNINGTACRLFSDRALRLKVTNPEAIF